MSTSRGTGRFPSVWVAAVLFSVAIAAIDLRVVAAAAAADGESTPPGKVLHVDAESFDSVVLNARMPVMAFFHAPWCGHCKAMAPEYEKAASQLRDSATLVKIDGTVERALAERYKVGGYPTLLMFAGRRRQPIEYRGERSAASVAEFARRFLGSELERVSSVDELQKIRDAEMRRAADHGLDCGRLVLLGVFPPEAQGSSLHEAFRAVASGRQTEFVFVETSSSDLMTEDGGSSSSASSAPGLGTVLALADFEGPDDVETEYNGPPEEESLGSFADLHAVPLVGEMTQSNRHMYARLNSPMLIVYGPASGPGERDFGVEGGGDDLVSRAHHELVMLARLHRGNLVVCVADTAKWPDQVEALSLVTSDVTMVIQAGRNQQYVRGGPFDRERAERFVEEWALDYVPRYIRSEPVPVGAADGPVRTLVGRTFESAVFDESKDVLVQIFAPWCGHCKSLSPIYDELGRRLAVYPTVLVAKMDGTKNDFPSHRFGNVGGFPAIFVVPAQADAVPVHYKGQRTVEALEEFVRKHAALPLAPVHDAASLSHSTGTAGTDGVVGTSQPTKDEL